MNEKIKSELIEKISFFNNLHAEDKELIKEIAYFKAYKEGETIIKEGGIQLSLLFLINGQVSVHVSNEFVTNFRGGGQPFGEMSFVNHELASASIISDTKTTFLIIDVDKINKLTEPIHYRLKMNIYYSCAQILAKRLKATNEIAKSYLEKLGSDDADILSES